MSIGGFMPPKNRQVAQRGRNPGVVRRVDRLAGLVAISTCVCLFLSRVPGASPPSCFSPPRFGQVRLRAGVVAHRAVCLRASEVGAGIKRVQPDSFGVVGYCKPGLPPHGSRVSPRNIHGGVLVVRLDRQVVEIQRRREIAGSLLAIAAHQVGPGEFLRAFRRLQTCLRHLVSFCKIPLRSQSGGEEPIILEFVGTGPPANPIVVRLRSIQANGQIPHGRVAWHMPQFCPGKKETNVKGACLLCRAIRVAKYSPRIRRASRFLCPLRHKGSPGRPSSGCCKAHKRPPPTRRRKAAGMSCPFRRDLYC